MLLILIRKLRKWSQRKFGENAIAIVADVSQNTDVSAMIQLTMEQYGRLDILVNNAGTIHRNKLMTEVSEE